MKKLKMGEVHVLLVLGSFYVGMVVRKAVMRKRYRKLCKDKGGTEEQCEAEVKTL